jgi:ApbE family
VAALRGACEPVAAELAAELAVAVDVRGDAHEHSFAAMGTTCHVVVHGRPSLLEHAAARIAELERAWSRFLPDSEITRLNRAGSRPVAVGNDTFLLVSRAVESWRLTEGRYDPPDTTGRSRTRRAPSTAPTNRPAPLPLRPAAPRSRSTRDCTPCGYPMGCCSTVEASAKAWPPTSSSKSCSTRAPTGRA